MVQKKFPVAGHAFAIVSDPVQQNDRAAIKVFGMYVPALQRHRIRGLYADFLQLGMIPLADRGRSFLAMPQRQPAQLQASLSDEYAGDHSQKEIKTTNSQ